MTTMELIEKGIGHNCLADAYDLGRADAYSSIDKFRAITNEENIWIVSETFMREHDKQIRAELIDEIMELKGKHCDSCSMQSMCGNDCLKNILEGLKHKSNGEE